MTTGPTNGAAKAAGASATAAPLTPEEQATYQRLIPLAGPALVNRIAVVLGRAGLPVVDGGVSLQWGGAIMYRVPLVVGRQVSPRVLFDALGGSTPEASVLAQVVLDAEARALVGHVVPATRTWAGKVDGSVHAARKAKGRGGPPDNASGDAVPTPEEPRRIILSGGG